MSVTRIINKFFSFCFFLFKLKHFKLAYLFAFYKLPKHWAASLQVSNGILLFTNSGNTICIAHLDRFEFSMHFLIELLANPLCKVTETTNTYFMVEVEGLLFKVASLSNMSVLYEIFIEQIYNTDELDMLHQQSIDYNNINNTETNNLNDVETDLHKQFYNEIKTNDTFKKLYCSLIKDIYSHFFPNEDVLIYQSYPSIRLQFFNSIAVPPHCDSDSIGKHPIGEKNFIVPITKMENTNSLYIESFPEKGDFESVFLEYGDLFYFNGNKCIHKNEPNLEKKMRISFDFRVILLKDYLNYLDNDNITFTNPRDKNSNRIPVKMTVGGYYQITYKNEDIDKMLEWYKIPNLILQHRPTFGEEEAEACYNYMKDDNFITEHKKTSELEKMICNYLNVKNCIMTTSCTAALILSLMSLNLNNNDEVIVPNYTMIATVNSVKHLGLIPIIIDVDSETYSMTLEEIKKNITPKTKAVIHVSINNRYKDLEEIYSYCKEKNIILIEQ